MGNGGKKLKLKKDNTFSGFTTSLTTTNVSQRHTITFSFSFFRQIEYFGIGECSNKWFIGLLERMQVLCTFTREELILGNRGNKTIRCHPIQWDAKNVPIKRGDFYWLPKEVLYNDDEFPIMQLSISTSNGRIIGFFDKDGYVFNVLLLDYNHNLQPSKKDNYQLQSTTEGISQYTDLLNKVHLAFNSCPHQTCDIHVLFNDDN